MHADQLLCDGCCRPYSCSASPLIRQISDRSLPISFVDVLAVLLGHEFTIYCRCISYLSSSNLCSDQVLIHPKLFRWVLQSGSLVGVDTTFEEGTIAGGREIERDEAANEADTCRKYVVPKLMGAGWDNEPHSIMEQRNFTDGRIVVIRDRPTRRKRKRADYLLRHTRDFTIAVVEAKANYKNPGDGLQQAKEYAEILGLKFAYATNGEGIIEFDYATGQERELDTFPSPDELWSRYCKAQKIIGEQIEKRLLTPYYHAPGKAARYYQEIAINRSIEAILQGKKRILLTMATGTGKTLVAFQICWKLWESGWNAQGRTAGHAFSTWPTETS